MKETGKGRHSLNMRSIFRCMMEDGYYPTFEATHIEFGLDENTAIVEYEDGILAVRMFFSIEEEGYDLFLEASNSTMMYSWSVKAVVLDDMKNLMFSCEIPCDTVKEFRKFFPRCTEMLRETLKSHKSEMRKLILADHVASTTIPATDDYSPMTGKDKSKIFS